MTIQSRQRRGRSALTALLSVGVLLSCAVGASHASSVQRPQFESGTYDVWQHGTPEDPLPSSTGRVIELHVRRLTLQVDTYSGGSLRISRILVPANQIIYDGHMRRWYQDFETAPNNPKAIH